MTLIDVILGLMVAGAAIYVGSFAAVKVTPLLAGLYRIHPVVRFGFQANIGIFVALLVAIFLSVVRIRLGFIPSGAEQDFPGYYFGISVTVLVVVTLTCHLAIALLANVLVRKSGGESGGVAKSLSIR